MRKIVAAISRRIISAREKSVKLGPLLSAVTVPNARLELSEKEQARLCHVIAHTADWFRSNAVKNSLQIETAVIEKEPK